MKRSVAQLLIFFLLLVALVPLASAQATRTWVSGVGDDANPCSRTAPCKTWAGAISKTAAGGEMDALDPAGFGALTITKSITIDGGGGQVASVLVAATNGINVVAGANDTIILRNLRFNGLGGTVNPGLTGINFTSGKQLIVDKCEIFGFITGINASLGAAGDVAVSNTVIAKTSGTALSFTISSGKLHGSLNHVSIVGAAAGLITNSLQASVDISESSIVGVTGIGLNASSGFISSESNVLSKNGTGAQASTFGTLRLSNTDFFDNTVGIGCGGGVVASAGNNRNSNTSGGCAPNATLTVQ